MHFKDFELVQSMIPQSLSFVNRDLPGEPKSGGHVTITHQTLASTFPAFCSLSLSRSDKNAGKSFARLFLLMIKTHDILFLIYLASK